MRSLLASSLLALSFSIAAPALAKSRGFDTTVTSPLNSSVKIEVVVSEDMAHRANNLPEKLSDRSGARGLRSGFAGNGFYGDKDIERLTERLQSKLERKFEKKGIEISQTAPTVLRITIEDAKPNRPTFNQLSVEPSLSFQSFGNGGAELQAELIASGGQSLGTMSYKFYETDIRDAKFGGTWGDAHRAFSRFASKAAKTLAN
ncbi:DUF3313 family protein [Hellea balneolensis]|uniref:DUF3313 family protein n=1 Tax=Hellea balneolensis TaxID=287478 RepID=UPI000422CA1E|nr:DUF3313 family protein [Hellea balneolensis]